MLQPRLKPGTISLSQQDLILKAGLLLSTVFWMGTASVAALAAPGDSTANPDDAGDVVIDPEPGTSTPGGPTPGGVTTGTRFVCQTTSGQPTVMYQPESQPGQLYAWAVPSTMGGGWDASRRCFEISRRLESYRPDGLLEMQTGIENEYNTICVTTQRVPGCRIVLTVPPGQDPVATRDRVFQNLTIADSGQQTQGVNTFVNGGGRGIIGEAARLLNLNLPSLGGGQASYSSGINLRPFLDRADGGTGQYLRGGRSIAPGRRLNPSNFR